MPYANSIEIATATIERRDRTYVILLEGKRRKRNYTFIRSRYLRMVILSRYYAAITGDWFYDWWYKTGKIRILIPV